MDRSLIWSIVTTAQDEMRRQNRSDHEKIMSEQTDRHVINGILGLINCGDYQSRRTNTAKPRRGREKRS